MRRIIVLTALPVLLPIAILTGAMQLTGRISTASGHPASTHWYGLPLHGKWVRTSLHIQTNALLTDPGDPGRVWAGTTNGVWVTNDAASTWRRDGTGLSAGVASLGYGRSPLSLFAGDDSGAIYQARMSASGNPAWTRINVPLGADHPVFCIAPSPVGSTVLAGTFGALYRGVQKGEHWRWSRVYATAGTAFTSILWSRGPPRRVYAAAFSTQPAVISSADGGGSWRPDASGLPSSLPTQALAEMPGSTRGIVLTTMGGGVWLQSPDGSWSDISEGLPAHHAMPLVATSRNGQAILYAGTMGFGVFARQGDLPWQPMGSGLHGARYTSLGLVIAGARQQTLLVATAFGVYRYAP